MAKIKSFVITSSRDVIAIDNEGNLHCPTLSIKFRGFDFVVISDGELEFSFTSDGDNSSYYRKVFKA